MKKQFFNEINDDIVSQFKDWATRAPSIVVASHISPDDDSISSVLSIYYYVTKYLKVPEEKVRIIYTGDQTSRWANFANFDKIEFVDDLHGYVKDTDLLIVADGSGWKRFSRNPGIAKSRAKTICIDHHPTPEDRFDLHLVVKGATSTAEVIYKLFFEVEELDRNICEILFLGLSGDTGNFKYLEPKDSHVFLIAERLVREGEIVVQTLQSKYNSIGLNVYKAIVELMKNSEIRTVGAWPAAMTSFIDLEVVKELGLKDNEISEASGIFTSYLKGVEGSEWGFVITPRGDKSSSISLRSLPGSVNVRAMMERSSFGGGHDRASGGKIRVEDPREALKVMLEWMEKNIPVLS